MSRPALEVAIKRNRNKQLGQVLVICEATGGYERHVLDVAIEMGLSVHRAHGTRVRHFGRYCGLLAKTDLYAAEQ
jgi:transposase